MRWVDGKWTHTHDSFPSPRRTGKGLTSLSGHSIERLEQMAKMDDGIPNRLLVALGGNAIHPPEIRGTGDEQVAIAADTARALLPLMRMNNELVITHGNGPGVGKIIMRQTLARKRVEPVPLDICVANSQGGIAYLLQQAFENELLKVNHPRDVVCLLTQVEVDPDDPAFQDPTKPVGYFFDEEEAKALREEMGWVMREDSGRGWRLVVPSPQPKRVCNLSLCDGLAKRGVVVIAGGGGGIPVKQDQSGARSGVEAVIDKDLTSALLANALGIETMMILTGISRVAINFGTPQEQTLEQVTVSQLRDYKEAGHFPAGSMGPKVEAVLRFIAGGGKRAIIAHLEELLPALQGEAGTHIVMDS